MSELFDPAAVAANYVAKNTIGLNWTALRVKDSSATNEIHQILSTPTGWKQSSKLRDRFFVPDVWIYTMKPRLPAKLARKMGFAFVRIYLRDGDVWQIRDAN